VNTVLKVFKERKMDPPIFYLHNHDFNGLGGHIGQGILNKAQSEGFNNMVIDAGYRKNGTHNDNTVVVDALNLSAEQHEALVEYNHVQQLIEQAVVRFDSRTSQMTPWDSDWAGGTEGSDIRIAKEYNIDPRKINQAKEVATDGVPLERAVTPFSEYKLRLGIAIMIEEGIEPKSADKVREWVSNGGKLKVGGDVLVGLHRWETLVSKTPYVDMLLKNMPGELEAALQQKGKLIGPGDLPANFTLAQKNTALGYQQKGLDFATAQAKGTDLSPLLCAPHILHAAPLSVAKGTRFEVVHDAQNVMQRETIQFDGFGKAPNGDILVNFQHEGQGIAVQIADPNAVVGANADLGPRKASGKHELGCAVPGEVLLYNVKVGDVLKEGEPLCVLESMKMEMKISVPAELDGMVVANLPCRQRTKTDQGDLLAPGDLLLELKDP
jgi:biotin carboxyl carrier protein